jgi:hypothetical protein
MSPMPYAAADLQVREGATVSRHNKVNPDHYTMAGRLSPDDLARERMRQGEQQLEGGRRSKKAMPPWMANDAAGDGESDDIDDEMSDEAAETTGATEDLDEPMSAAGDEQGEGLRADEGAAPPRRGSRPAPRRKAVAAKRKSTKTSGARRTAKTRKSSAARGAAARGAAKKRGRAKTGAASRAKKGAARAGRKRAAKQRKR